MHVTPEGLAVPFCSVRLPDFHTCHLLPGQEDELIALFKRFPDVCDGVWFATDYGYPTVEVHHESARRMVAMAAKLRAAGIACSMQISNSLGHSSSWHHSNAGITWDAMIVGMDGQRGAHNHCPRSPEFRAYLRATMTEYARVRPDFIWIDDDMRMWGHGPVRQGCFCEVCLQAFGNAKPEHQPVGGWTRESLAGAFAVAGNGLLRAAWTDFNRSQIADICGFLADVVWSVSPETNMGLQQACPEWGLYGGRDFAPVYNALSQGGTRPAGCRGGGGHYTDYYNRSMLSKGFDTARQFAALPAGVTVRCPEIENFVHGAIGKTPLGTAMEAAVDIAIGSNCLSIANMMYQNEEIAWHAGTFEALTRWKPYMDAILAGSGTSVLGGMDVLFPRAQAERALMPNEPATAWMTASMGPAYALASIGLPLCTSAEARTGCVLAPEGAKGIDEAELRQAVRDGLLMGGDSALILQERGLGAIIGARITPLPGYLGHELFTDDALNGTNGARAFLDNPFGSGAGVAVEPLYEGARILGIFRAANGPEEGIYTAGIELPDGGRVGIIGHDPWQTVISSKRRTQILNLADWVTHHRLAAMIDTPCQVVPLVRSERGGVVRSVTLLNQAFDRSPALSLRIRLAEGQAGTFRWMMPEGTPQPVAARREGAEWRLDLPPMERWSMGTLFCA